jgi:hypothetical protein
MRTAPRRASAIAATLLSLAVATTACSGDSSGDANGPEAAQADGGSSATDPDAPPPLATTSTLGRVTGKLPNAKQRKVRQQVTRAVDSWIDAAYVAGDYPRNDFSNAWPGFTTGAKADAEGDKQLMSNQSIGTKISAVEAKARKVTVDMLAVKGRPAGATARFVLRFATSGDMQRKIVIQGRLFLTPGDDGWQIFGYDVTKARGA